MTTAERTLKWWNDYKAEHKTYPLIAEVEAQLNMAVDEEKQYKHLSIDDIYYELEEVFDRRINEKVDSYEYYKEDKEEVIFIINSIKTNK